MTTSDNPGTDAPEELSDAGDLTMAKAKEAIEKIDDLDEKRKAAHARAQAYLNRAQRVIIRALTAVEVDRIVLADQLYAAVKAMRATPAERAAAYFFTEYVLKRSGQSNG